MKETGIRFLADAAGARIAGAEDVSIRDVKIDSREAGAGDMFVCVAGEVNDGHDYAPEAAERGCRVFLMSCEDAAARLTQAYPDASVLLVPNTSAAFRDMAKAYMDGFDVKKIAVTGSVGKTSTRNFTRAVLAEKYSALSAVKNLNTHLGLCLTCFAIDESTQYMVFEMGMDRRGEIAEYVEWVRPDVAIITNIGIAHLEKLGTREAIAQAKLEITSFFGPENLLIYNSDSDYLSRAEIVRRTGGKFRMYSAGFAEDADLRIVSVDARGADGIRFRLAAGDKTADFSMSVLGAHNAADAALAVAAGLNFGVSMEEAAAGLASVRPGSRRMDAVKLNGVYVIDDTYNASPVSMAAALDVLDGLSSVRKIAVLADMLELGSEEASGHEEVGRRIASSTVDILYAIGPRAKAYAECAAAEKNIKVFRAEKLEEVEERIHAVLRPGDAVLIKGSNVTGVAGLAERIRENLSWER